MITITLADDLYEFAYELITGWAEKQYTVDINGKTYELIELAESGHERDSYYPRDIIRAHPWNEETDQANEDEVVEIPIFVNHLFAIDSVHIH